MSPVCGITFVLALLTLVTTAQGIPKKGLVAKLLADGHYESSSFHFTRSRKGREWLLSYRFRGLTSDWHEVSCRIDAAKNRAQEDAFGYRADEISTMLTKFREQWVNQRASRDGKLTYGKAVVTADGVKWQCARSLVDFEVAGAQREEREFRSWLLAHKQELEDASAEAVSSYFQSKGFHSVPDIGWVPDYSRLVENSSSALQGCSEAFHQATGGSVELMMAFFQAMQYVHVPMEDSETGKTTGGLMLPPSVMIHGQGDCDSKAAAFCVLQRNAKRHLLIFRSFGNAGLKHALVGNEEWGAATPARQQKQRGVAARAYVELVEGVYKKPLRIGLRYYMPCEVAGEGRTLYGEVAFGKGGSYLPMEIEPLSAAGRLSSSGT